MGNIWGMDQSVLCGYSSSGNGWWDTVHEQVHHQGVVLFLSASWMWSISFTVPTTTRHLEEALHWTWERRCTNTNTIIYKSNRKKIALWKGIPKTSSCWRASISGLGDHNSTTWIETGLLWVYGAFRKSMEEHLSNPWGDIFNSSTGWPSQVHNLLFPDLKHEKEIKE